MLDPVYAVELEPGCYVTEDGDIDAPPALWTDRDDAQEWVDENNYAFPNARVVRFKLEEVRDDENG